MNGRTSARLVRGFAACLMLAASPAVADTLAQLDNLSRLSADRDAGIALARNQIRAGDLIGAVATLERILIDHPEADEVLLLHASLLCRLDDPTGSLVEFDYLRGRSIPDRAWAEATAPCAGGGTGG